MPFDNIKLKFGKHKGKPIKDVPLEYLKWCVANEVLKGRAMFSAKIITNHPLDQYEVTVEDSVNADGTYKVMAHNKTHAISVCKWKHKIQVTQSFCGTTFSATKL